MCIYVRARMCVYVYIYMNSDLQNVVGIKNFAHTIHSDSPNVNVLCLCLSTHTYTHYVKYM